MGLLWNMGDDVREGTIDTQRFNQLLYNRLGSKKYYCPGFSVTTDGNVINAISVNLSSSATKYIDNLVFKLVQIDHISNSGVSLEACLITSGSVPSGSALTPISKNSINSPSQAIIKYCNTGHNVSPSSIDVDVGEKYWCSIGLTIEDKTYPKTLKPGEGVVCKVSSVANNKFLILAQWDEYNLNSQWWETEQQTTSSIFSSLDESGLPSWMFLSRSSGPYSYQIASASFGSTFIRTGSIINTPRFHWTNAAKARGVLVEPRRINQLRFSRFISTGSIPDGWIKYLGTTPDIDFVLSASGPCGEKFLSLWDTLTNPNGIYTSESFSGSITVVESIWVSRRAGSSADVNFYAISNGTPGSYPLGAGPYDWTRKTLKSVMAGVPNAYYIASVNNPEGVNDFALPQIEEGSYASTWIPTSGGAETRPSEKLVIDASVMPLSAGVIEFDWVPGYSSTDSLSSNVHFLFSWADGTSYGQGSNIFYYVPTNEIYVLNNAGNRAHAVIGAFTAWNKTFRVRLEFGLFGTRLIINGAIATNATAWVAPQIGPGALGSSITGTFVESSVYKNLRLLRYL